MEDLLGTLGQALLLAVVAAITLGLLLIALVYRRLRRIRVPPDADFFTTIRAVPLGLVVGLDLLDAGLDIFATPIVWVILSRFRLQALRNIATAQAIVPFTQPVPLLTVSWILARLLNLGTAPAAWNRRQSPYIIDADEVEPGTYRVSSGRR
jgi:hypothetical protein